MPITRKEFIKLGLGIYTKKEDVDYLLKRYGKYSELYPKSLEDSIYIFALDKKLSFPQAEELSKKLLSYFEMQSEHPEIKKNNDSIMTDAFRSRIAELNEERDLLDFIAEYWTIFNGAYNGLVEYIDDYIIQTGKTLHALLKEQIENPRTIAIFNNLVSELRTKKVIPKRMRLIALGILLDMNLDKLDHMLSLARLERVCAKDRVEFALIFALESILANNPTELRLTLRERFKANPQANAYCLKIIRGPHHNEINQRFDDNITAYLEKVVEELKIEEAHELLDLLK
jgi:hypothetical protein